MKGELCMAMVAMLADVDEDDERGNEDDVGSGEDDSSQRQSCVRTKTVIRYRRVGATWLCLRYRSCTGVAEGSKQSDDPTNIRCGPFAGSGRLEKSSSKLEYKYSLPRSMTSRTLSGRSGCV